MCTRGCLGRYGAWPSQVPSSRHPVCRGARSHTLGFFEHAQVSRNCRSAVTHRVPGDLATELWVDRVTPVRFRHLGEVAWARVVRRHERALMTRSGGRCDRATSSRACLHRPRIADAIELASIGFSRPRASIGCFTVVTRSARDRRQVVALEDGRLSSLARLGWRYASGPDAPKANPDRLPDEADATRRRVGSTQACTAVLQRHIVYGQGSAALP